MCGTTWCQKACHGRKARGFRTRTPPPVCAIPALRKRQRTRSRLRRRRRTRARDSARIEHSEQRSLRKPEYDYLQPPANMPPDQGIRAAPISSRSVAPLSSRYTDQSGDVPVEAPPPNYTFQRCDGGYRTQTGQDSRFTTLVTRVGVVISGYWISWGCPCMLSDPVDTYVGVTHLRSPCNVFLRPIPLRKPS